jgi:hypothetical protein
MQTGGYDVVAEVRKELLNKFMQIGFCTGMFPVLKGSYTLPIPNIPADLKEFTVIGYEVSLDKEPVIDITTDLHVTLNVRGEAKFTVLGGIDFELDVEFTIGALPSFNQATRRLHIDFVQATVDDVALNDTLHLPANVITKLNQILSIAMHDYLTDDVTSIELSPVLFATDLPYMPPGNANKLTIGLGNFKIFDRSLMGVAVNLLGYNGGNINSVTDFVGVGNNVGVGVSESSMHRVYDFWWSKTTHPKEVPVSVTHDFDVSTLSGWVSTLSSWATGLATLGLYDVDIHLDRVWADCGATIKFGKFSFNLKPGNHVELSGSISADVTAQIYAKITTTQQIIFGLIDVSSDTSTLTLFDLAINGLKVTIDHAEAKVYLDPLRRLTVDITDLDLSIDLPWELPEDILNYIVNWVIDQVVKNLPPIVLFPAIVEEKIPGSDVTVDAAFNKLTINEDEALVAAQVDTSGKETYAPYVANKAPEHMELHKKDCEWAHKIALRHRVYYCKLEDAFADGFDGCAFCLPQYNHR